MRESTMLVTDDFTPGMDLPMDPGEVRGHWVHALLSGAYPQGRGCLADGNCRCALGVLCEVCHDLHLLFVTPAEMDRELPPYSVCMCAGVEFDTVEGGEASGLDVDFIMRLNDDKDYTHAMIAREIVAMFAAREGDRRRYTARFTDTPGLGGTGEFTEAIGGDLTRRSEKTRI